MTTDANKQLLGLDHVQLAIPVGGETLAREFWVKLLGLDEVLKPPALAVRGGAWFESSSVVVHVGAEVGFTPAVKAHPAFKVRDLDALAASLSVAGYEVRWDEEIPDVRRFHSADPFGNRLEFISS